MNSKLESEQLIEQLRKRFEKKPRKCRKINDSGIGSFDRVVYVANGIFYYYPKIQEFNDLDYDKLQYVVPKAGIPLVEILELKFPPRRMNERNYFSITIPKNKIFKYTKTFTEILLDQSAVGEQVWKFVFDYDILSLPEYENKQALAELREKEKQIQKKKKEEQDLRRKEEEKKKKLEQEYETLIQNEKALNERQESAADVNIRKKEEKGEVTPEKINATADDFYFQVAYERLMKPTASEMELIELELDLLEVVGNFKKRAVEVVRNYIDQMPHNPYPQLETPFVVDNLKLYIGFEKSINLEFLDTRHVAHELYNVRRKIQSTIRIPLEAFIKYKGFKVLVRAMTPIDLLPPKQREQKTVHGLCQETWKTHFFRVEDLGIIIEGLNLKTYQSVVYFQNVLIHIGSEIKMIESKVNPYDSMRHIITNQKFLNFNINRLIYIFDINETLPIDVDLEENVKQTYLRLRPQFVQSYTQNGERVKLVGGALTYENEDDQGQKNDVLISRASQNLKYDRLPQFVKALDQLQIVPLSSRQLSRAMKSHGINMRYLGVINKLTTLPYIRLITKFEAIARQIKEIFRDIQKEFVMETFRSDNQQLIEEAYDQDNIASLRLMRKRQLKDIERNVSVDYVIDFLNLVFGKGEQTEHFWISILRKNVKDTYKIQILEGDFMNTQGASYGYLLRTVLDHCGIKISFKPDFKLFMVEQPFTAKDFVGFESTSATFTFPSMEVYKKMRTSNDMSEESIKNRLKLGIYLKRVMGDDQSEVMNEISLYEPTIGPPKDVYSVESLIYYINHPTKDNFETAYDICTFLMPSTHPIFQELYLSYSRVQQSDCILFKKAAENHAIRTLGLNHWKTSKILTEFKQDSYLKHLLSAEVGVKAGQELKLMHLIVEAQYNLGRYNDCFMHCQKAIKYAELHELSLDAQNEYFGLLMIAMEVTYRMRKIYDMMNISEYFWNSLEKYRKNVDSPEYIEHILYYCLKSFLQNSERKFYILKLAMIQWDKIKDKKIEKKEKILKELREMCREAKNHKNWIKDMLSKLTYGYTDIGFLSDFFTKFDEHIKSLESEEIEEGLAELTLVLKIFKMKYFEESLMDRYYKIEKESVWDIPKKKN